MIRKWTKILPYFIIEKMVRKFGRTFATLTPNNSRPLKVHIWMTGDQEGFFVSDVSELKEWESRIESQLRDVKEKIRVREVEDDGR